MFCICKLAANRFRRSNEGITAPMFALSFMIIFLGVGLAIDTGRAMHVGNKIANALDAAALAAAKGMREQGLSDDEVRQLAGAYFEENMKGHVSSYATLGTLSVQIDRRTSTVTVGTVVEAGR